MAPRCARRRALRGSVSSRLPRLPCLNDLPRLSSDLRTTNTLGTPLRNSIRRTDSRLLNVRVFVTDGDSAVTNGGFARVHPATIVAATHVAMMRRGLTGILLYIRAIANGQLLIDRQRSFLSASGRIEAVRENAEASCCSVEGNRRKAEVVRRFGRGNPPMISNSQLAISV